MKRPLVSPKKRSGELRPLDNISLMKVEVASKVFSTQRYKGFELHRESKIGDQDSV
jgi:hypothetical protein